MAFLNACPGSSIQSLQSYQLPSSRALPVVYCHSAPVLRHSQGRPQPRLRATPLFPFQQSHCRQQLHSRQHTCSARSSSVELPPQDYVPPAGKIESTRLNSQLRRKVEDAVEALGRRVTVGDVSSRAGVSLSEAEEALNALAADSAGSLEVSSAGEVLYTLPNNFKAVIRGRSWLLRSQPAFTAVGNAAGYLVRVAFGAALIASVTLVWTAILAVMSSSSNSSDDRNRSRGGGGGGTVIYMNSYMFRDLSNLFWYGSPRYDRMQQRRGQRKEMGFLESIFSFVFGDGNPNLDFEERRWKMVGELISRNGGVITAEQLAPYLDPPADYRPGELNEDFMVPALVRFGGSPSVDQDGQLLYTFPSLQSMGGAGRGRREKLEAAAMEKLWKLSKAQGGQKWGGAALGIANLVGVLVLQGLLASRGVQATQYAELATALSGPLFLLKVYALSFFLIPALRWVSNAAKNRVIEGRNDSRAAAAKALRTPSPVLQRKLDRAHAQAQQRVIRSDEIIYNSDRGSEEVDDAGADFDRRLNGEQRSSEQLADARLMWDQKQQEQKQQRRQRGGW